MKSILLPDDIYERAAQLAAQDQVSVDRLVSALVKQHLGDWSKVQERGARGSVEKLKRVLAKVRDVPAKAADQI